MLSLFFLVYFLRISVKYTRGVTGGGATAQGDTIQGVTP